MRYDRTTMHDMMPPDRESLLQESPNPVIIYRDGQILWANETACGILMDPIGSDLMSHVFEEDKARIAARVSKIQGGQVDGPARLTIETRLGPRIIESAATLIQLPDGPAIQTTWRDLTDLERMRTWLEAVADSTSDLIAIVSLDGEIQYMNQALLEFRGEHQRTNLPDGRNLLDHVGPGQEASIADAKEALRERGRWRGELELLSGGVTAAVSIVLQRHRVGGSRFFSAIGRDVSAERDLRNELGRAVRERDTFAARVAHELKNPLAGVIGTASLLGDGDLSDDQRELIDLLVTGASDLQRVVDDLTAFSASGNADVSIENAPVDLRHEVEHVVLPIAESAETSFRIVGQAQSIADPNRVRQVVRNLCINAVLHGGGRVSVELTEAERPSVRVGHRRRDRRACRGGGMDLRRVPVCKETSRLGRDGIGAGGCPPVGRRMDGDLTYRRSGGETVFTLDLPSGRS